MLALHPVSLVDFVTHGKVGREVVEKNEVSLFRGRNRPRQMPTATAGVSVCIRKRTTRVDDVEMIGLLSKSPLIYNDEVGYICTS